jgi:hypothetical protein
MRHQLPSMKNLVLLYLLAALAPGQVQNGRVATNYAGAVAIFETAASLAGEAGAPVERIMENVPGGVAVTATSPLEPLLGGVMGPRTNDNGDLRAYSLYRAGFTSPIGGAPPQFTGVVRHIRDGWEVQYPGRAGLSRDGRWAVFAGTSPIQTLWVDLWTSAESALAGLVLNVDSVADDGSLTATRANSLIVYGPGVAAREFVLPFQPSASVIERNARYAAVYGADGLWRVNLATGGVEPWVRQCNNCQTLDLGPDGTSILYRQWSILYLAAGPGSPPRRLTREGQLVDSATLNGRADKVIAVTPDGIAGYDLRSGFEAIWVYGPTSFTRQPSVLAPGMWVRQEGRGLVNAEIRLNGSDVQPLQRSSSDLVWVVPEGERLGPLTVEIGQSQSPFAPATRTSDVQLAAPTFVLQADAGIGSPIFADWPIITHAATGRAVDFANPARPGELIEVVMTGINGQGPAVEWLVSRFNVDEYFYPVFESAAPAPGNPNWTVVRLRMPEALPGGICVLSAIYGDARSGARINLSPSN